MKDGEYGSDKILSDQTRARHPRGFVCMWIGQQMNAVCNATDRFRYAPRFPDTRPPSPSDFPSQTNEYSTATSRRSEIKAYVV
jgi:hypothetical protein